MSRHFEDWADHPWAGDDDGHNCAECIAKGDTLRMCMRQWHVELPAFPDDPVAQHFGWVDGVPACTDSPCRHGWAAFDSREVSS